MTNGPLAPRILERRDFVQGDRLTTWQKMSIDTRTSDPASFGIAAVERDTGLSKDTLRVWERRYGFPAPARGDGGERTFTRSEIEKLRLVKRLLDAGHRPGRIVPMALDELQALTDGSAAPAQAEPALPHRLAGYLETLRRHDARGLRSALRHDLVELGLAGFVTDVVAPLNTAVGDAWLRGQIEVFEEHLYTEAVQVVLRQSLALLPDPEPGARPRVLLTTLRGEPHGLGLLMAEALLSLGGADCLALGLQTPSWDIVLAARAQPADIVSLGFSGCMNPNQVVDALAELRSKLDPAVELWAGGSAPVLHRRRIDGVLPFATLAEVGPGLLRWRASKVAHAAYRGV